MNTPPHYLGNKRHYRRTSSAFTIIELIVVIVIIGILTAVTVVGYNAITKRSVEASMRKDIDTAYSQLKSEITSGDLAQYPEKLADIGVKGSGDNILQYTKNDESYCLTVMSPKLPGKVYKLASEDSEVVEGGTCAGHDDGTPGMWADVVVGTSRSIALSKDGRAYMWGKNNSYGSLGNGTKTDSYTPTEIDTTGVLKGKKITDISIGRYGGSSTPCVIADGGLYCWGDYSLMGKSASVPTSVPVRVGSSGVLSGKTMVSIEMGEYNACALDSFGKVYCWGQWNEPYQVQVPGTSLAKKISLSRSRLCVLTQDSTAYCSSSFGGVSDLEKVNADVLSGALITDISSGMFGGVCLIAGSNPYCWGDNYSQGDLHLYSETGESCAYLPTYSSPELVCPRATFSKGDTSSVSAGYMGVCSVTGSKVRCWGNMGVPKKDFGISFPSPASKISISYNYGCAVVKDKLYCWSAYGDNNSGQLGNGTTSPPPGKFVPVNVNNPIE